MLLPRQHVHWCCLGNGYFNQPIFHINVVGNISLRMYCWWANISCWRELHCWRWLQHLVCVMFLASLELFMAPFHLQLPRFPISYSVCTRNGSICTRIACAPSKQLIVHRDATDSYFISPPLPTQTVFHTVHSSLHAWKCTNCPQWCVRRWLQPMVGKLSSLPQDSSVDACTPHSSCRSGELNCSRKSCPMTQPLTTVYVHSCTQGTVVWTFKFVSSFLTGLKQTWHSVVTLTWLCKLKEGWRNSNGEQRRVQLEYTTRLDCHNLATTR